MSERMERAGVVRAVAIAAGIALGLVYVIYWATHGLGAANDIAAYVNVDLSNPYTARSLNTGAFNYTPAFAMFTFVLKALPFDLVVSAWRLLELAALILVSGPFAVVALLTPPVASELNLANVNLLIGFAIVAGFRWPALWSIVLITKPTCGIGLIWFVARREWRPLAIAFGATVALFALSVIVLPNAWPGYVDLMRQPAPPVHGGPVLWQRLPFAIAAGLIGAWRGWRPLVLVAAWFALPAWHDVGLSVLAGALAFAWRCPLVAKPAPRALSSVRIPVLERFAHPAR